VELARARYAERPECLARACSVSLEVMEAYLSAEDLMQTWKEMALEDPFVQRSMVLDESTLPWSDGTYRPSADTGPLYLPQTA
jgi:hypothetical protein